MSSIQNRIDDLRVHIQDYERDLSSYRAELSVLKRLHPLTVNAERGGPVVIGEVIGELVQMFPRVYNAEQLRQLQDLIPDLIMVLEGEPFDSPALAEKIEQTRQMRKVTEEAEEVPGQKSGEIVEWGVAGSFGSEFSFGTTGKGEAYISVCEVGYDSEEAMTVLTPAQTIALRNLCNHVIAQARRRHDKASEQPKDPTAPPTILKPLTSEPRNDER